MMSKKTLLLIAAIAVMLAGATSAYAYYEWWSGWFNSGYLTFLGSDTFDYTSGQGILDDTTSGSVDSFLVATVTPGTFTCATSGPYLGYYIKLWPGASGYKYTGQSGHKEAHDGAWTGKAILYNPDHDSIQGFTVVGTWNTTDEAGDYFNYYPETPTYSAKWDVSYSIPVGLDGYGGSAGDRIRYED